MSICQGKKTENSTSSLNSPKINCPITGHEYFLE